MIRATIACVVLFLFGVNGKSVGKEYRDVTTGYGVVRGYVRNGGYFAYLGIPYAASPVGENRFKAPLPPEKWNGIYEATRTVKCPQNGEGDEDCLILNIFTPSKPAKDIPVLVYIHGGSFLMGSGQTTGVDALIKNDIIVVTINYRLGALGFLCLGTEDAPGNAGLKDQVAALRWIQDNISEFGGDPGKVTIYGMSAGAASVELLVLSDVTKGLFRYAIVESAAATPVWVVDPDPIETAYNAVNVNPSNINLNELVKYYKTIPHEELSEVNKEYYNILTDGTFGFVPCIERNLTTNTAFLIESPHEILSRGNFDKVPIMFLFATSEGLYLRSAEYYEQDYKNKMEDNFAGFLPADLIFDSEANKSEIAKEVKRFYFGDKRVGDDSLVEYLNFFGDSLILHGLLNSVEMHSKDNPVYLMEFSYKGKLGSYENFYDSIKLAGHGDVVKYAILNKAVEDESDRIAVERVAKLISNFAESGNPTADPTPLLPVTWPVVEENKTNYLLFGTDMIILDNPYRERKLFWEQLYSKFRRSIHPVDPEAYQ